ncbi:unnamed protein product [Sphagnum jensenii]|uniref:Uncharacterized protein n=1 Tax=Sphagnum jensenii TaxID=128206 RepID=A0ABP1BB71_9BRYO
MEGGEQAAATTGGSQSVESERRDEARLHIGSCRALRSCSPPSRESLQRPLPPRLAEGVVVGTGYSG